VRRSVAIIFFSLTLALFLLLAGFFSVYYDHGPQGMYAQYTREKKAEVKAILHFLDSNDDVGALSFLDASEQSHMADVRRVLNGFRTAFFIIIVILFFQLYLLFHQTRKKRNDALAIIKRSLVWGGGVTLLLVALLALSSLFDFTGFWTTFHHILFPQGNWQFPDTSALITLFPEAFFSRFATQVLLATGSFGTLAAFAGCGRRSSLSS
jgi:uncharacterized membrane protein